MEALRVEQLSKDFGGVRALQYISFGIEAGERLAIIGPNGAGKTTLLNVLNGRVVRTSGRIYFYGQEITAMALHHCARLGIARSFQNTALFPYLTVLDNVLLGLQGNESFCFQMIRSRSSYKSIFAKAEELLGKMGLWEKRGDVVKNIAHGEQQKLEIVLSLASQPKLLLLDEPTSGLTPAESSEIVNIIHELGRDITVLVVAHDMDLVFGVADRIIVLHYGQIVTEGTPKEIQTDSRVKQIYIGNKDTESAEGI